MPRRKPRCWRVLVVEHEARPGPIARARADVIVREVKPGHWRVEKNRTGKHISLR